MNWKTRLLSDYGMLLVLLALCVLFSLLTLRKQSPEGAGAARDLAREIQRVVRPGEEVVIAGAENTGSADLARRVDAELQAGDGDGEARLVVGDPRTLRLVLDDLREDGRRLGVLATSGDAAKWRVVEQIPENYPEFGRVRVLVPGKGLQSGFLQPSNLLAVVDRIVVIAVIAIGMTLVIITGGIDLSVGSLIALSAVISTLVMKGMGGLEAPAGSVLLGFAAAIAACGVVGGVAGGLVARFRVAPFIVTLGVMMMARGLAFMFTGGFSIYQVPPALTWLGQGRFLGLPNTVLMLTVLYALAHLFMSHTRYGRYIYAVGGNAEAARLSGVPVRWVIALVYVVSGVMAGIGGCIQASQVNTGTPNMGTMYELYVIAAVVVGGTSLAGGTGRIMGTLIGAFIIAVIQNGMNLLGIDSYTQMFVLGAVIVGAVLLDKARQEGGFRKLLLAR